MHRYDLSGVSHRGRLAQYADKGANTHKALRHAQRRRLVQYADKGANTHKALRQYVVEQPLTPVHLR